ncbi:expressed unknown protein (Partial), partial [Seminavis robusta]
MVDTLDKILATSNFYAILGVTSDASKSEISKSYKRLSLKVHPDKHSSGTEDV